MISIPLNFKYRAFNPENLDDAEQLKKGKLFEKKPVGMADAKQRIAFATELPRYITSKTPFDASLSYIQQYIANKQKNQYIQGLAFVTAPINDNESVSNNIALIDFDIYPCPESPEQPSYFYYVIADSSTRLSYQEIKAWIVENTKGLLIQTSNKGLHLYFRYESTSEFKLLRANDFITRIYPNDNNKRYGVIDIPNLGFYNSAHYSIIRDAPPESSPPAFMSSIFKKKPAAQPQLLLPQIEPISSSPISYLLDCQNVVIKNNKEGLKTALEKIKTEISASSWIEIFSHLLNSIERALTYSEWFNVLAAARNYGYPYEAFDT